MGDENVVFGTLKDWILELPGVTEAPHRFRGTEFQVEGLEFMHSHGPSFLDIRLSKDDQARALKDGTALPHRFAPQAGWVSFRIGNETDLEGAKKLVRLAYENAKRSKDTHASRRIQSKLA